MTGITVGSQSMDPASLVNRSLPKRPTQDIAKASTEFEAILLDQVLGKLRETFSMRDGSESDPGSSTLSGVAEQSLCKALASRGGVGLAAMIRRSISEK
ncbi:hypothetical protein Acid345_2927 [Candidatus Koribacter versatilis Ellin345]|uniref:Flagellar protein FlgJ N-terminal domain-containing protein n=1 Tax=Koribacter versatilis (strain Ellin345) TaxID=204669 RepID=Q1IMH2_KORVE|nr:hypothetical protein [Candidatus Koribacter versatilis]ABF41928.1 hypothetical protein Acid345_2927 [Candidatus Koribacter versatilis Ellin345]